MKAISYLSVLLASALMVCAPSFGYADEGVVLPVDQSKLQDAEEMAAFLEHLGVLEIVEDETQLNASEDMEMLRRRPPHRRPPRYRRPPHRRPPYRRPPRYYPRPRPRPPHYLVTCYSENARGIRYSYTAYDPVFAQRQAMNTCYRYSNYCYSMGCY